VRFGSDEVVPQGPPRALRLFTFLAKPLKTRTLPADADQIVTNAHHIVVVEPVTPTGTYTLTVTGSTASGSTTLSHSMNLALKVS
jgi:hypothetical protein